MHRSTKNRSGVAHNFPLRSPFDPASVYGNRSSSSLIVDVFSAPRPLACQWPPPNQISRVREQPLAPTLNSSLRNLLRLGCRGGGGTSRVRPGPGTYTGTWNESRLLQGVHVCTPPLVTSPHASCNACVHSDYNSRSPRRPNLNAVYV